MKRLNIGCGEFKKSGYINGDIVESLRPDIVIDLEKIPYPFKDECFDLIEADHVLEHLGDPFAVMGELHRLLKPSGKLVIRVPHFSRAMTHPQHKSGFDITFPYYFDPDKFGDYTGTVFTCEHLRLKWFSQMQLVKRILPPLICHVLSVMGIVIDALANLSPALCSRIWCYWVGGFYEIEYVFRKP